MCLHNLYACADDKVTGKIITCFLSSDIRNTSLVGPLMLLAKNNLSFLAITPTPSKDKDNSISLDTTQRPLCQLHTLPSSNYSNNDPARCCTFLALPGVDFALAEQASGCSSLWWRPSSRLKDSPACLSSLTPSVFSGILVKPTPLAEPPSHGSLVLKIQPTTVGLPSAYRGTVWAP